MIRTPAVLLLAALACPSFAHAAEPAPSELLTDAARSKAEAGLALFQQARWSEAYENFRIAEELFHAPSLLMRMAHCQRELGHFLAARVLYRRVFEERLKSNAPPAYLEAQADAQAQLALLKPRIARVRIALADIDSATAQVTLDSVPVALAPAVLELDPGEHHVEAKATGAEAAELRFTVAEGADKTVSLTLRRLEEKIVVVNKSAKASLGLAPGLATLGLGIAGVALGGVTGGLVLGRVNDLEAKCGGFTCPRALEGDKNSASTLATVSTAGFIAGGVGIAASALLVSLHFAGRQAADAPKRASVALSVTPSGGSVVVQW